MEKNGKINIEYMDIIELKPYLRNPRHNDNVDFVAESIQRFGFLNPIVIDGNNEVVAGHTRLLACKKLNIKKIPIIRAEHLTPEQIRAYRIIDNKTTELGKWDKNLLSAELMEIKNFDMSPFMIEKTDLNKMSRMAKTRISPYSYAHVLITLPIEKIEEIPKIIKYCETNGYEYIQSNN